MERSRIIAGPNGCRQSGSSRSMRTRDGAIEGATYRCNEGGVPTKQKYNKMVLRGSFFVLAEPETHCRWKKGCSDRWGCVAGLERKRGKKLNGLLATPSEKAKEDERKRRKRKHIRITVR